MMKESEQTQSSSLQTDQAIFAPKRELMVALPAIYPSEKKKQSWSFDLFSFLQYREHIAGLAVLEDSLVYTFYRMTQGNIFPDAFSKEPFFSETISNGILHNEDQYAAALRRLFATTAQRHANSVILSILPHHIWITTLEFPKTLDKNSLIEAINLYFEFSLPFPKDESYIDWEILDNKKSNVQYVMAGAVYKKYIDPYLAILKKEGMTAIAVESHLMSVARVLRNGNKILIIIYPSGAHIGAYTDTMFRFQRFIPWEHIQKEGKDKKNIESALVDEIKNIMHFLATEMHAPFETEEIILIAPQDFRNAFEKIISLDPLSTFFRSDDKDILDTDTAIVRGAALRGLLSRKDDTIMSFTAVGTEKIYEWKRAISFSAFFEKLVAGLGIFFVLLYMGSFFLVKTLAARAENRQILQGAIAQNITNIQNEARRFNQTVEIVSHLTARSPHWEKLLVHIMRLSNPGITITSLSADNLSSAMITGTATNRDALLQFKASINSSGIFQDIELPFTLLITKENLPFRFPLIFRDKMFLLIP